MARALGRTERGSSCSSPTGVPHSVLSELTALTAPVPESSCLAEPGDQTKHEEQPQRNPVLVFVTVQVWGGLPLPRVLFVWVRINSPSEGHR